MAAKGYLRVEKEGKTNCYSPALTHKAGLKREIERFLTEVVGPDPEHLELVGKALERRQGRPRVQRVRRR